VRRREIRLELAGYLIAHHDLSSARTELLITGGNAPDDVVLALTLAPLLEQAGAPRDALNYYQKVLAREPNNQAALEAAGRLEYGFGNFEEAHRLLERAARERSIANPGEVSLPPEVATMLNNSAQILALAPSKKLPPAERVVRILKARDLAKKRFESCNTQVSAANGLASPLQSLSAQWMSKEATINLAALLKDLCRAGRSHEAGLRYRGSDRSNLRRTHGRRRPAPAARQISEGDGAVVEMEKQPPITGKESRTVRAAAEEMIARMAGAREEHIFLLLSIFTGVISGLLVVSFRMAIEWLSVLLLGSSPQPHQARLIVIPALAGLVIAALARFVFPNVRGSGINQTKAALYINNGYISFRTVIGKFLLSALAIGSGYSLGPEDPSLQIGAGVASLISRRFGLSKEKLRIFGPHRSRSRTSRCLQRAYLRHPLRH